MKDVTTFYIGYLEKDAAGHYNMFPSNAHETFWKVKNPATDLAAIRFLFPAILDASRRLNLDSDLRPILARPARSPRAVVDRSEDRRHPAVCAASG